MDWDAYEVYDPGTAGPLHAMPRAEARRAFKHLMSAKESRIDALRKLLKANGIELTRSDAGIQDLNDWFRTNVQPDPRDPERLLPEWYSVVNDIALFLGDVLISRHPNLRWELFTSGARNTSYQRHVIMGFRQNADPQSNLDIDVAVAIYGHRVIAGESVDEEAFWKWLRNAGEQA